MSRVLLLIAAVSSFIGLFTPFALEMYKDSQVSQRQMRDQEIKVRVDLISILGRLQARIGDVIRSHQLPQLAPEVSDSWQRYYDTCTELTHFLEANRSPFLLENEGSSKDLLLSIDEVTSSIQNAQKSGDARYHVDFDKVMESCRKLQNEVFVK